MKINKLRLKDIVKNYEIREQEFEYAGINGIAELLGWQIMFFRKKDDLMDTVAISFNEIDNTELINIANTILRFIGMNIRFSDNVEIINSVYGTANFSDSLYEDITRYNYILTDSFMVFGFKNNRLSCLEIVTGNYSNKYFKSVYKVSPEVLSQSGFEIVSGEEVESIFLKYGGKVTGGVRQTQGTPLQIILRKVGAQ